MGSLTLLTAARARCSRGFPGHRGQAQPLVGVNPNDAGVVVEHARRREPHATPS